MKTTFSLSRPPTTLYTYVYNYTDHLGNIRLRYTRDPEDESKVRILEENSYYPFGLKHEGYNGSHEIIIPPGSRKNPLQVNIIPITPFNSDPHQYKYNGKEYQDELRLNWTSMDFRNYDSAIGRFNGMDRFTMLSPDLSPYRFAFNNPVYWSDPSGLYEIKSDGNINVNNENGNDEVAKLLAYLKNNEGASIDEISKHIITSGEFMYDLDEIVITVGS